MNTQPDSENDFLKKHLNPEMIEKAPPGFTGKVMHIISLEPVPASRRSHSRKRSLVPFISVTIMLVLVIAALFLPSTSYDYSHVEWIQRIKIISQMGDKIIGNTFSSITLPAFMPYLFLGIFVLTFFDKGLNSLFHKH